MHIYVTYDSLYINVYITTIQVVGTRIRVVIWGTRDAVRVPLIGLNVFGTQLMCSCKLDHCNMYET